MTREMDGADAFLLNASHRPLRRSELGAIGVADLEATERHMRLVFNETKSSQTEAVIILLPYGETKLCPMRVLKRWVAAAGISNGQVFRRIWRAKLAGAGEPLPCPRPGSAALTAQPVAQTRASCWSA